MVTRLFHRGPDDKGFFQDSGIGLANARLSIIDPEEGHQPLSGEDGNVWVTFNGEIFNFKSHRERLEAGGHDFTTNSDTEVLVHLYEEMGRGMLSELNGMFAFALWDREKAELLLARDYAGMKPLYYCVSRDGTFRFASEIKALIGRRESNVVNLDALADFLLLGYLPRTPTLFSGISKLRPGSFLVLNRQGIQVATFHQFTQSPGTQTPEGIVEKLREELKRAARAWLMSDVPVGAYVSGGLDSSLILALAAKFGPASMKTYTAWFGPDYSNELQEAGSMAEFLGVENIPVLVSEAEVVRELPKIAWHYDEPVAEAAVVPTFFVSKRASRDVKVVLAGEGADELFGGYPWHRLLRYSSLLTAGETHRKSRGLENHPPLESHIDGLAWPGLSLTERYLIFHSVVPPSVVSQILPGASHRPLIQLFADYLEAGSASTLCRLLHCDTMTLLAESFLMKADKGSMANSVEERTPYLDKHVMEFALGIPDSLKLGLLADKLALRKVARPFVPRWVYRRKKRGYGTPVAGWVQGEIGEYLRGLMDSSSLLKHVGDAERTRKILNGIRRPTQLWLLGSLALWEEVYHVTVAA